MCVTRENDLFSATLMNVDQMSQYSTTPRNRNQHFFAITCDTDRRMLYGSTLNKACWACEEPRR